MSGPAATQANYRISSTGPKILVQPPNKTPSFDLGVKKSQLKGIVSRLASSVCL